MGRCILDKQRYSGYTDNQLGLENTFDFCFNGIEKGSTVAVSTYMACAHGNRADQKDFFMAGYNEMLKRIEPETIICWPNFLEKDFYCLRTV